MTWEAAGFLASSLALLISLRARSYKQHKVQASLKTSLRGFYLQYRVEQSILSRFDLNRKVSQYFESVRLRAALESGLEGEFETKVNSLIIDDSGVCTAVLNLHFQYDGQKEDFKICEYLNTKSKPRLKDRIEKCVSGVISLQELSFVCQRQVVSERTLTTAFEGVKKHYHEQRLKEYSRYKDWRQSCYMEVHKVWTPQVSTLMKSDGAGGELKTCRYLLQKTCINR